MTRWHPSLEVLPPKDRGAAGRGWAVGFPTTAQEARGSAARWKAASSSRAAAAVEELPVWTERSPSFPADV